ncbi:MAG: nitroreductase [Clostridiales bacterium]|jgi:nitroreductase|nr:nitroreductase [Clostridiales bacterium]HOB64546.1 nitroreductase family protein [Clostridia bacterium]HOK81846.1 nitroreductase family protein [Clostridia bacterium]HOL60921.1 nitroreductase family protein [Clostridia bacterium]HPO53573.1 nitroreductase family protein [Clostridia bacterium]
MEAITAIYTRQSTKDFIEGKQISSEDLSTILKCGMTAPVGMRRYDTLHLTVVQSKELLDEIMDISDMRTAERPHAPLYKAPTIILVSSRFEREDHIEYANVACVIENMTIAATALGLGSVYLWSVIRVLKNNPGLLQKFNLPEGFVPVSVLALGYPATPFTPKDGPRHEIEVNYIK